MLMTIHGLPPGTKYKDVKTLLNTECKINDYILDNLLGDDDGPTKKVRVGVADDSVGIKLMNMLDGYRLQGCMLKVVPIGNPGSNATQQNFSRPSFSNPQRNDYPNQRDFSNQQHNDYAPPRNDWGANRGPQGPRGGGGPPGGNMGPGSVGPHGHSGANRPSGPNYGGLPNHGGTGGPHSQNSIGNRPSPWGPTNNSSAWTGPGQGPQNTFNYNNSGPQNSNVPFSQQQQQSDNMRPYGRPQDQNFGGFPPKINAPESMQPGQMQSSAMNHHRSLRPVDTEVGGPPVHDRYPPAQRYPPQDKQMSTMKDNFQGPPQYNMNNASRPGQFQAPANTGPWAQPGPTKPNTPFEKNYDQRNFSQDHRRPGSPMQRRASPPGRRISPPGRRISPGRRMSPPARPMSPSGRKYSPQGRRHSPFGERISPSRRRMSPGRRISPPGKRISPSGRRMSPSGRRISPSGRRMSPSGRRMSPSGRRMSPMARRMSPSNRRISPGRHITQQGRQISPLGRRMAQPERHVSPTNRHISQPGRHISPPGRHISQPGRHISPLGMRISPSGRRMSPGGRRFSPASKRISPSDRRMLGHHPVRGESPPHKRAEMPPGRGPQPRFSPARQVDKPLEKYGSDKMKQIRPAYEANQAPSQAMYSGGYRAGHDSSPYSGPRSGDRAAPWQRDSSGPLKKQDDERRDVARMPSRPEDVRRSDSLTRKSRSPIRRERSSPQFQSSRFKRLSPSSRSSRSPRRSWALEKRCSPEVAVAPPPPVWPGQSHDDDYPRSGRPSFPERKEDKPKHTPVWEGRADDAHRRMESDRRQYSDDKVRAALAERERMKSSREDRYSTNQPKFSPQDYDTDRRDLRRRDTPERKLPNETPRRPEFDDRHFDDYHRKREPSPHQQKKPQILQSIDKDFEDIYTRTLQFKKKAEELRRSNKREGFVEEERTHDRREREERSRYEDRHRHEPERPRFSPRRDDEDRPYRPREEHADRDRLREEARGPAVERPARLAMSPDVRAKRNKAIEEICRKMIERSDDYRDVKGEQKLRIFEELKTAVARIVYDMFGDGDVSFIEIVVKYQARYSAKDEVKILEDVMRSLPSHLRLVKRHAPEAEEVPVKKTRPLDHHPVKEVAPGSKLTDGVQWNLPAPGLVHLAVPAPVVMPAPYLPNYDVVPHTAMYMPQPVPYPHVAEPEVLPNSSDDDLKLYLCHDDFEPFSEMQVEYLKAYLFAQVVAVSEQGSGWMPEFTIKGLQSMRRYELLAKDERSRDWILNLDFSGFQLFNVLVYKKEELWYERAAVYLPGHSRVRSIEPLDKLRLQNRRLDGVDVDKWKLVKKVVNAKGTRLYVDMPPASARALQQRGLALSYELQQVSVFLKAGAVDERVFDSGMREASRAEAATSSPMPSIAHEHNCVKITLKGSKTLPITEARKIKEVVIYKLFEYHKQNGASKTDFVKYGFYPPNFFGIVPANRESERWLLGRQFGKVNRQTIVVMGAIDENTRFFRMHTMVPREKQLGTALVQERLRYNNQGVRGINFNVWKPVSVSYKNDMIRYEVDIDLESIETLSRLKYNLDYVDMHNRRYTAHFKSEHGNSAKFEKEVEKFKAEMTDSYDVNDMDLDSDDDSNRDVICLE